MDIKSSNVLEWCGIGPGNCRIDRELYFKVRSCHGSRFTVEFVDDFIEICFHKLCASNIQTAYAP